MVSEQQLRKEWTSMFEGLVVVLGIFLGFVVYADWLKTRDPFYPTIYLCPQLAFVYVFYPLQGAIADKGLFEALGGGPDALVEYQAAILFCLILFVIGIRVGAATQRHRP